MAVSNSPCPASAAAVVAHALEDLADQHVALRRVRLGEHPTMRVAAPGGQSPWRSFRAPAAVPLPGRIMRARNAFTRAVASGSTSRSTVRSAHSSFARFLLMVATIADFRSSLATRSCARAVRAVAGAALAASQRRGPFSRRTKPRAVLRSMKTCQARSAVWRALAGQGRAGQRRLGGCQTDGHLGNVG